MRHCFIINPAAGSGREQKILLPQIIEAARKIGPSSEVHRTSGPGEATIYVRSRLQKFTDEKIRFYACGGDGTVAEVVNGLYGAPNAELAVIPAGSGNDYVRNFENQDRFLNIDLQIAGRAMPVDVICYSYEYEGDTTVAYALNMINMGFDAKVVGHMNQMKNKIFLKGTGAYVAGVLRELAGYKMSRALFQPEGEEPFEADILLAGVGNGRFSGGGFDGIPSAVVDDGLLDFLLITPISRMEFLRCVGDYHDGKHFDNPLLKDKYMQFRTKEVKIISKEPLIFAADGEPLVTDGPLTVSMAHDKVHFVIPKTSE